jgi:hypothetical protein
VFVIFSLPLYYWHHLGDTSDFPAGLDVELVFYMCAISFFLAAGSLSLFI